LDNEETVLEYLVQIFCTKEKKEETDSKTSKFKDNMKYRTLL